MSCLYLMYKKKEKKLDKFLKEEGRSRRMSKIRSRKKILNMKEMGRVERIGEEEGREDEV